LKKITALVLGLVLLFTAQAGSVFASSTQMEDMIEEAIGSPYKSGGTTVKGFDCSGFTTFIFDQMGIELPRTSKSQADSGTKVEKSELKQGDLVFFDTAGNNNGVVTHVGIYVGDGSFVHASTSRGVVTDKLSSSYYAKRYVTARRVMDENTFAQYATVVKDEA